MPASGNYAQKQVRLAEVAQTAGVSVMTASRVVRGLPGVTADKVKRVKAAVRKLGYKRSPLVSAYQAHVRGSRTHYATQIAWLNDFEDKHHWHRCPWICKTFHAAVDRIRQLGFTFHEVHFNASRYASHDEARQALRRSLHVRSISTLLIPTVAAPEVWLRGKWTDGLTVVRFDGTHRILLDGKPIDLYPGVWSDSFTNARIAVRALRTRGYTRPALFITRWQDNETNQGAHFGFLAEVSKWPDLHPIPPLVHDILSDAVPDFFVNWIRTHRPDVLFTWQNQTLSWLNQMGLRVPEDIGLIHLSLTQDVAGWSGIDPQSDLIGQAAVDLLVSRIQSGDTGRAKFPVKWLLEGSWTQGTTTR